MEIPERNLGEAQLEIELISKGIREGDLLPTCALQTQDKLKHKTEPKVQALSYKQIYMNAMIC
jgi:hypothetical protein